MQPYTGNLPISSPREIPSKTSQLPVPITENLPRWKMALSTLPLPVPSLREIPSYSRSEIRIPYTRIQPQNYPTGTFPFQRLPVDVQRIFYSDPEVYRVLARTSRSAYTVGEHPVVLQNLCNRPFSYDEIERLAKLLVNTEFLYFYPPASLYNNPEPHIYDMAYINIRDNGRDPIKYTVKINYVDSQSNIVENFTTFREAYDTLQQRGFTQLAFFQQYLLAETQRKVCGNRIPFYSYRLALKAFDDQTSALLRVQQEYGLDEGIYNFLQEVEAVLTPGADLPLFNSVEEEILYYRRRLPQLLPDYLRRID